MTDAGYGEPESYLVVGSGSIAKRHIGNLKRCFPRARVGCVSGSGRSLVTEECGAHAVFPDLPTAIAARPRFAIVANAATRHLADAAVLLDAGIPVLTEKPLADSLARARQFEPALRPHLARLDVAYNLRFLESARRLKRVLDAGEIGRLHAVLVDVGQYLPDWRPSQDYRSGVSARRDLGGGVLLEMSHEIDYLGWLLGGFDSVFCRLRNTGALQIDVEDVVDAMLLRADGLVVQLHLDFLQRAPTRRCKIIGERGSLLWEPMVDGLQFEGPGGGVKMLHEATSPDRNGMYLAELEHFSRVVDGAAAPSTSFEEGVRTLRVIEALRRSAERSAVVSLEEVDR